jgi:hypothetical protein
MIGPTDVFYLRQFWQAWKNSKGTLEDSPQTKAPPHPRH